MFNSSKQTTGNVMLGKTTLCWCSLHLKASNTLSCIVDSQIQTPIEEMLCQKTDDRDQFFLQLID